MRVVIDTNVLMSGLFWPSGPPRKILELWAKGKFAVVVTPEIVTEYRDVTNRLAAQKSEIKVSKHLDRLLMLVEFVLDSPLKEQVCTDPDDDIFISAAVSGRASYIVTGDKALLAVDKFRKIQIIKPAPFLNLL